MAASLLAWKEGGGADARTPAPHVDVVGAPADSAPGHGAAAYEVTARLVDALGSAQAEGDRSHRPEADRPVAR